MHDLHLRQSILQKNQVLADYKLACESKKLLFLEERSFDRKSKVWHFWRWKKNAQLALPNNLKMATEYYRDQTWMMAIETR